MTLAFDLNSLSLTKLLKPYGLSHWLAQHSKNIKKESNRRHGLNMRARRAGGELVYGKVTERPGMMDGFQRRSVELYFIDYDRRDGRHLSGYSVEMYYGYLTKANNTMV